MVGVPINEMAASRAQKMQYRRNLQWFLCVFLYIKLLHYFLGNIHIYTQHYSVANNVAFINVQQLFSIIQPKHWMLHILMNTQLCKIPTSPCHRHHGLRMIYSLQTESLDGSEHWDDHIGLVRSTGPVISIESEACSTGTREKASGSRQTQLLTCTNIITTASRGAGRG